MLLKTDNAKLACYEASELGLRPGIFPAQIQLYDERDARALYRGITITGPQGIIGVLYTQVGCDVNTGADVVIVND